MRLIFLIALIYFFQCSNAQSATKTSQKRQKIGKYNKKKFSENNFFYSYNNETGTGAPKSKLKLVRPDRAFWGDFKEQGDIILIQQDRIDKQINGSVNWIILDSALIDHPKDDQLTTADQIYYPEAVFTSISSDKFILPNKQNRLGRVKYRDFKFVLQALTIPLKYRKPIDTLTYQTETSVNVGFGGGIKWTYNWYKANKSFLGQKTNQLAFTPGLLLGLGAADITANQNASATFKSRKEPVVSYGVFFLVGFNSVNIGFALGKDNALKEGGEAGGWVYNNKYWKGIIVALDVIK
jgi:hypothetical protein